VEIKPSHETTQKSNHGALSLLGCGLKSCLGLGHLYVFLYQCANSFKKSVINDKVSVHLTGIIGLTGNDRVLEKATAN
jgi:hypothetical protein